MCRVASNESLNLMGLSNLSTIFAAVLVSSDTVSQFTYLLWLYAWCDITDNAQIYTISISGSAKHFQGRTRPEAVMLCVYWVYTKCWYVITASDRHLTWLARLWIWYSHTLCPRCFSNVCLYTETNMCYQLLNLNTSFKVRKLHLSIKIETLL